MGNKITDDYNVESVEHEEEELVDMPEYGSADWNAFVMSRFHDEELIDGNPLCYGLRRVANELLGDIVSSRPTQVFPSVNDNGVGRATVVYEIVFNWGRTGEFRTFGDVAEVWHGNTEDLFAAHAAATACTKAEGRVLRKALMVKCLAAEELPKNKDVAGIVRNSISFSGTTGEVAASDLMSSSQLNFLNGKAMQLNVNLLAYLSSKGFICRSEEDVKKIKKLDASNLIKGMNEFQSSPIPENLKGYDSSWR